jgi:chemotaxis family two-component system response regulator Rcp1
VPSNPARVRLRVVLAEDDPADELLVRESLARRFPDMDFVAYQDGEQMMRWIDLVEAEYIPCPDVILLDLNLPRFTGEQVLERLRDNPRCSLVPVVIVTTSDTSYDRAAADRLGATRYFHKPSQYDEFLKLGDVVHEVISLANAAEV